MSQQPGKYARTSGSKIQTYKYRADRGMGRKGDEFYARRSGGRKPIAGESLLALEQKLAVLTTIKP
jgi:hypothetical protein